MSKIKAKDLSYDSTLPPFLQRLHDQNAGRGDTDRHERAIARPRRAKDADAEDDGPTVVDESGEVVSREEFAQLGETKVDAMLDAEAAGSGQGECVNGAGGAADTAKRAEQNVTDGAGIKKRKAGKIVGVYDDTAASPTRPEVDQVDNKKVAKKQKKKGKPIKLAFDDGEEG